MLPVEIININGNKNHNILNKFKARLDDFISENQPLFSEGCYGATALNVCSYANNNAALRVQHV